MSEPVAPPFRHSTGEPTCKTVLQLPIGVWVTFWRGSTEALGRGVRGSQKGTAFDSGSPYFHSRAVSGIRTQGQIYIY
jgi:hypothetical protein